MTRSKLFCTEFFAALELRDSRECADLGHFRGAFCSCGHYCPCVGRMFSSILPQLVRSFESTNQMRTPASPATASARSYCRRFARHTTDKLMTRFCGSPRKQPIHRFLLLPLPIASPTNVWP